MSLGIKTTAADKWFSKALRQAFPICEMCGWRESTQLCHIKGRRTNATRYAVDNALAGCFKCHQWMGENPLDFGTWLDSTHPGRRDRIDLKARGILKNTAENRKLVAAHYRSEYHLLMEDPGHTLESWN